MKLSPDKCVQGVTGIRDECWNKLLFAETPAPAAPMGPPSPSPDPAGDSTPPLHERKNSLTGTEKEAFVRRVWARPQWEHGCLSLTLPGCRLETGVGEWQQVRCSEVTALGMVPVFLDLNHGKDSLFQVSEINIASRWM